MDTQLLLDKYVSLDSGFASSRERQLIDEIVGAWQNDDLDSFTQSLTQFDRIIPLDEWKTMLLLRIKKLFEQEPDLL
jgi:alpha-soluble NSF attachment protein